MLIKSKKVLITGASGFVGYGLLSHLISRGYSVKGAIRHNLDKPYQVFSPDLNVSADWSEVLSDVSVVVHCAARVHVMNEKIADPLSAFRTVNTDGTLHLARQAAAAGVKRFIFLSSVKVNGECTEPGKPFSEGVITPPTDPYGLSKYEAELGLLALARECDMEVVILRLPLIYGAGVKANFASMIRWVRSGIPLPFSRIKNRRSILGLGNLCDFITHILAHPAAANQVFMVADAKPISTSELMLAIGDAVGNSCRLFYVPRQIIYGAGKLLGLDAKLQRLYGSLEIDTSKARDLLAWSAPFDLTDELNRAIRQPSERN